MRAWSAFWSLRLLVGALTIAPMGGAFAADKVKPVDFNRDILPILSDNCFACHGPDANKRKGKLRLDTKDGIFAERDDGDEIVVPGKSAVSELYARITSTDDSQRMPERKANRQLTSPQVDLLKRWIDEGASYTPHWAYVAPKRPELPAVNDQTWVRNPIDNFVLARLETEGLKPSPEADRATLLRRVSFDLTGLPPTLAELDAFLADRSANAYEKQVDRLLASPHYGEKMARTWLDLSRYADSNGSEGDNLRDMWAWRDWVIKAYNQNLHYDEFTIKQIAGDLLPNATRDDKIATGFSRNHLTEDCPGADPKMVHTEAVVDRVNTTGTTWLGLTVGCARCHDHKFDPIKQKDFYKLFAFFNTVAERGLDGGDGNSEPVLLLPKPEQKKKLERLQSQIGDTLDKLPESQLVELLNRWRRTAAATIPEPATQGLTAHYEFEGGLADSSGHGRDATLKTGEILYRNGPVGQQLNLRTESRIDFGEAGDFERNRAFSLSLWVRCGSCIRAGVGAATGVLEKRDNATHWQGYTISFEDIAFSYPQGAGRFAPAFRLVVRLAGGWPDDAIEIRSKDRVMHVGLDVQQAQHVVINYDGSGKAQGLALYVDGERVATETEKDHLIGNLKTAAALRTGRDMLGGGFEGQFDDLRIYDHVLTSEEVTVLQKHVPARADLHELADRSIAEIMSLKSEETPEEPDIGMLPEAKTPEREAAGKAAARLKELQQLVSTYYLREAAPKRYRSAYTRLERLRKEKDALVDSFDSTMVMAEMKKPRDTFVLGRGQFDNPREKVSPDVPSFLLPLPKTEGPVNRLTLAQWLMDPANPLTARVEVNRYWQNYFGIGIVKTAEDFGSQGERPSNPQLLDWLATEFIRLGWDIKAMQRLIVLSATYRQSSRVTPELRERDPENRLLARGPRVRLAGEEIRDNALAASGLLAEHIGGRSVYPYQPKGLWEEVAQNMGEDTGQIYTQGTGEDLYRRSLYIIWKRLAPPPTLATFDAPDRTICAARRTPTNTPLQALILLNDPTYLEASRALAQRTILREKDDTSRLQLLFRRVLARDPTAGERETLLQLQKREAALYLQDQAKASSLINIGASKADPTVNPVELAAWTTVASAVFNMDEAITKQ